MNFVKKLTSVYKLLIVKSVKPDYKVLIFYKNVTYSVKILTQQKKFKYI